MKKINLVLILILCALMGGSPLFAADKKVVVEGFGDNNARGREDAKTDAMRKAIEKAVGTYVSVEMQVENRQVMEEKIYSRNNAFIKQFNILSQGEKDGLWMIRAEVTVSEGKIRDELEAFEFLKRKKGNPRLMVIVKVTEQHNHWYSNPEAKGVRAKIENRLLRNRFRMVDIDQVKNVEAIETAAAAGDAAQLKALAGRYGAEIIVTCEASKVFLRNFTYAGRTTKMYSLDVALKAVITDTAQMIYSDSRQVPNTGKFEDLYDNTVELSNEMIKAIKEKWQNDVFNAQVYEITVLKATYNDLLTLKEGLEYGLGVKMVIERSFAENTALLEIEYYGSSQQLGMLLEDLEEPDIKVLGRSANKFKVEMVKGAPAPVRDTTPPKVKITMPPDGTSLGKKHSTVTVAGTVDDPSVQTVNLAGSSVPVRDGNFSGQVTLKSGVNSISASATDAAGNTGSATVNVTLDDKPPFIRFRILNFETRTFEGMVEPGATLTVNGKPVAVDKNGNFKFVLESAEYTELKFVVTDQAGNVTERIY